MELPCPLHFSREGGAPQYGLGKDLLWVSLQNPAMLFPPCIVPEGCAMVVIRFGHETHTRQVQLSNAVSS